jgi:hypothetical protein
MDPLNEIENAKAQHDLGVTAFRIFRGARAEGATRMEALIVAAAFFYALGRAAQDEIDGDHE